jgi:ubiquinone/menaquinone biosynthesis C-methylase UbiE
MQCDCVAGCGNGRYLEVNESVCKIGCDYSSELVQMAKSRGREVLVCDNMALPLREGCCDAVISIAVIHHFSSHERRVQAIRELARITRPGGRIMIYVWAFEQKHRKVIFYFCYRIIVSAPLTAHFKETIFKAELSLRVKLPYPGKFLKLNLIGILKLLLCYYSLNAKMCWFLGG